MAAGLRVEQVAELQLAYPTFTEAVSMAAQKICRAVGIGNFPRAWSYLGPEELGRFCPFPRTALMNWRQDLGGGQNLPEGVASLS
jgi:hypothetical protein